MSQDEQWLLKEKYDGVVSPEYLQDLERLNAGKPLAYVIGHVPFLNCTIYLDSQPLIPRPETEFWIGRYLDQIQSHTTPCQATTLNDSGLALLKPQNNPSRFVTVPEHLGGLEVKSPGREWKDPASAHLNILDLCAGSGCIGIGIAKTIPEAHITFGEVDPLHAPTILKNCLSNGIPEERFTIITSDLFEKISCQFDFILSNPPYIDPVLDRTESSVKKYEPHQALYGGSGGVEVIEKIIAAAPAHLNDGGQLWVEHEPEQSDDIASIAVKHGFSTTSHKDQFEVIRYSILVLK